MPLRRPTTISFLRFVFVLCLAIIFGPKYGSILYTKHSTTFAPEEYPGGKHTISQEAISPNQPVIRGAAIQDSVISSHEHSGEDAPTADFSWDGDEDFVLTPPSWLPLSLGIESGECIFTRMISRTTMLPKRSTRPFITVRDNQEKVIIRIFEGQRAMASMNRLIGTLELSGLPPKPQGALEITVMFEVDEYEILTVTAMEKESGRDASLTTSSFGRGRYTADEVDAIVSKADDHYEKDKLLLKECSINNVRDGEEHMYGVIAK